MPPTVRDLQTAIAQEQAALKPQQQLLDEQITNNANAGQAQEAGLRATQQTAFGQIEQGAQNKGMLFSGFTPDEQAKYTANTYLPALANLQATIAGTRAQLIGKKADLDKSAYDKASAMVENDKNLLADWNKMTAQQKFQADEADKQRVWEAQQRETQRNFEARQASASRSFSASQNAQPTISKNKAGGWTVSDPNMDLAGYARATGKDLITLLSQGDAQDRKAAQYYKDNIRLGRGEAYAMNRLMYHDRPTAFYRGG